MTEIPEHLLARSRARKSGPDAGGASAPAVAGDAAPATAAAASAPAVAAAAAPKPEKKAEPLPPEVQDELTRAKVPIWASVMLVALPIWAMVYAFTLEPPTVLAETPLAAGSTVYGAKCATCHGATGGGNGSIPKLADGAVLSTFPKVADQVEWVYLGAAGYKAAGHTTYGATKKTPAAMPGWGTSLTAQELMDVVLHERTTLSKEKFDIAAWEEVQAVIDKIAPEKSAEYKAVIAAWKATPPT